MTDFGGSWETSAKASSSSVRQDRRKTKVYFFLDLDLDEPGKNEIL